MSGWHTLAGTALGFSATVVPEFVQMLKDHFEHDRSIEQQAQAFAAAQEGLHATPVVETRPAPAPAEDCAWLTSLKTSVRPILTFLFFGLFAAVKLVSLYHGYYVEHMSIVQAMPTLWDDETETLFSAIVSFWFGQRALGKGTANVSDSKSAAGVNESREVQGNGRVIGE